VCGPNSTGSACNVNMWDVNFEESYKVIASRNWNSIRFSKGLRKEDYVIEIEQLITDLYVSIIYIGYS
jgi:hypothetical protein